MYNFICRFIQFFIKIGLYFIRTRTPEVIEGENPYEALVRKIAEKGTHPVLIVSGGIISELKLFSPLIEELKKKHIKYAVFDKTVQNPTIDNIEDALKMYQNYNCNGIIAFGGGSPMDCAKLVAARVAQPQKSINQLRGMMKIGRKTPIIFAVPTTAGSGSETTPVAVVIDPNTHEKFAVSDTNIVPHYVIFDPSLTVSLPPHITAATGMDALTHAIEAYIGHYNNTKSREASIEAVQLIFANLPIAYSDGKDLAAREKMLRASFLAGTAFSRGFVGYVHALAHQIGGFYNLPHGHTNAILLPKVLEYYGESVYRRLAELANHVGIGFIGDSEEMRAKLFIKYIEELNSSMKIPDKIPEIKRSDIPNMVKNALLEANPVYPVPKVLIYSDLRQIYESVRDNTNDQPK